jgi:hypothetical protein
MGKVLYYCYVFPAFCNTYEVAVIKEISPDYFYVKKNNGHTMKVIGKYINRNRGNLIQLNVKDIRQSYIRRKINSGRL